MNDKTVSELTKAFVRFAEMDLGVVVSAQPVEALIRDVLFTSRKLAPCLSAGLVTTQEVAGALAAHLDRLLSEQAGRAFVDADATKWAEFIARVEDTISPYSGRDSHANRSRG